MDLKPGEIKCEHCDGLGFLNKNFIPKTWVFIIYGCVYCNGTGKIDWITNIVGPSSFHLNRIYMNKAEYYDRIKNR